MKEITRQMVLDSVNASEGEVYVEEITEGFIPKVKCDECGKTKNDNEFVLARGEVRTHLKSLESEGEIESVGMQYRSIE